MTPAFTRSALNKGIQMNEVKRYKAVINDKPYKPYAYCEESSDGIYVRLEDYIALREQLTATTNSLTNAQEALKSAGIEADTVQAGVMELVSRMNQVVAKGKELAEEAAYVYGKYNDEMAPDMVCDGQTIQEFFDVANSTKTTDACLNALRAEGIHFAANRILAAWECGFIDDTPAQAYDISGAVMSALEFLPNASPEEFKRDYADEVREAIAAQLHAGNAGKDGSHE